MGIYRIYRKAGYKAIKNTHKVSYGGKDRYIHTSFIFILFPFYLYFGLALVSACSISFFQPRLFFQLINLDSALWLLDSEACFATQKKNIPTLSPKNPIEYFICIYIYIYIYALKIEWNCFLLFLFSFCFAYAIALHN